MLAKTDRLRIRMLGYASRLLALGFNNRNIAGQDFSHERALGDREVAIARELLDILNETGDSKHVRNSRNLPNR